MTQPGQLPGDDGQGRRRAPQRTYGRRIAAAGLAVGAAALGLTVALRSGAAPACAATPAVPALRAAVPGGSLLAAPAGSTLHKGKATFYDSKGAGGNCSYPSAPADRLYVALSPPEYASAAACGGHLDVTGPKGTVRVLIMDQCPECASGHLDLSAEAFARIADPVQGVVPVSYRAVTPSAAGPLTFRIKEGASQWWFAVLVGNHGTGLKSVEARAAGSSKWRSTARQDYNYWLFEGGLGPGPYALRVTDIHGRQATATGIRMAPGQTQRSTVSLSSRPPTRSTPSMRTTPKRPTPRATTAAATTGPVATSQAADVGATATSAAEPTGCAD